MGADSAASSTSVSVLPHSRSHSTNAENLPREMLVVLWGPADTKIGFAEAYFGNPSRLHAEATRDNTYHSVIFVDGVRTNIALLDIDTRFGVIETNTRKLQGANVVLCFGSCEADWESTNPWMQAVVANAPHARVHKVIDMPIEGTEWIEDEGIMGADDYWVQCTGTQAEATTIMLNALGVQH